MSKLFSHTLRETPGNADISSHQLLLRAGYIRQLGAGIFSYLPLARRSMIKIENIMRQEMDEIGGQEITMPVVHPAEIWKETRRWYQIGAEMGRFCDRSGHDMVLAMTHEEVVSDLVRKEIRSYRQLPALIYHIQTKWRDDPRPRAGLIRVREFTMLDSYSLDASWQGLEQQYQSHHQAYLNIFNRCGLPVTAVMADVGMMGGRLSHEFIYLTPVGEDTLVICNHCGYTANRQVAQFRKPIGAVEPLLPVEKVSTPGVTTIDELCRYLDIPASKTAKAVFMIASIEQDVVVKEQFVFAVVRGDMEVNETKLANLVKARDLRPALEPEIRAIGSVPGYGSPIGVRSAIIVADDAIVKSSNLVAGANQEGYHLLNVNTDRDYHPDLIGDIAAANEGSTCINCGSLLHTARGVEVGNIFQLGTHYSTAMGCTYQDADGTPQPVVMGSYGIGVGRLLACVAEQHHDDFGLALPITVAPYSVALVALKGNPVTEQLADKIYCDMNAAGVDVLYDDRMERPGVKFMDADLIGIPLRITVGDRALQRGGVELKHRRSTETKVVPTSDVVTRVKQEINDLLAEIQVNVRPAKYTANNSLPL